MARNIICFAETESFFASNPWERDLEEPRQSTAKGAGVKHQDRELSSGSKMLEGANHRCGMTVWGWELCRCPSLPASFDGCPVTFPFSIHSVNAPSVIIQCHILLIVTIPCFCPWLTLVHKEKAELTLETDTGCAVSPLGSQALLGQQAIPKMQTGVKANLSSATATQALGKAQHTLPLDCSKQTPQNWHCPLSCQPPHLQGTDPWGAPGSGCTLNKPQRAARQKSSHAQENPYNGQTNELQVSQSPRFKSDLSSLLSENTEYISPLHAAAKAKQGKIRDPHRT